MGSGVDTTTTSGQFSLSTNTEKFSNTGFETDLTSWNTGIQPDSLSNLKFWLKSDAITDLNDGDPVTTWNDSSGNGNNPTQATDSIKPLYKTNIVNSKPVVRFDGTDDFLEAAGHTSIDMTNGPVTTFVAVKASVGQVLIRGRAGCCFNYGLSKNSSSSLGAWYTNSTRSGASPSSSEFQIWMLDQQTTQTVYGVNGTLTTQTGQTNSLTIDTQFPLQIGARYAYYTGSTMTNLLNGDIAEIIIYNSTLSSTDRSRIDNYLRDKYNITVTSGITSVTRDTSTTYNSTSGSAKLVTSSSDTGEFTQLVNVGDTNTYNLSAYAYTTGSAVTSSDVEFFYNGSTVTTAYTQIGSTGWYHLTGTVTGANASRQYGVQVKANKTVYVDNFSLNNYASSGTLTSSIFDTELTAASSWGNLTYTATTPTNTTASVKVRTSSSSNMSGATDLSSCTAISSGSDISSNSCVTDGNRYVQYLLTLSNTDSVSTPTFTSFSLAFSSSDSSAPSISLTALSPDPNTDTTPTLSGTATESVSTVTNVQFQMDSTSGSWTACTADDEAFDEATETFTCTPSALSDGSHTMYVRATDSNSNTTASGSESSDTFTIDATVPVSIDLDSPGDNSYTNSDRPTFKWKSTTDATAGLSKYVLEIDNPSLGSSQPSGDFTIDNIPTSGTTDITSNNKYVIHFDGFSDSDATNNYISVYTRSTSDWGTSENDGKLREGRVSWKVKAVDNASNETSSSRTLFVDRTNPNVEFTQINSTPFSTSSNNNFSTTDKTPTIFGKITDPLAGGDSSQTQDESGPKVASAPKEVNIKVEKKNGLTYTLVTLYKINMDNPYYTCDPNKTIDNSKQKCDKYLPFEYTPKENLDFGTYKITLSGKDKADNNSSEVTLTLNITTLSQITTPAEKKTIEEETKTLKPEEKEQIKQELEITKPTEEVPVSALEKVGNNISQTSKNFFDGLGTFTHNVVTGVGNGIAFVFNKTGEGIAFVFDKTSQGLTFIGNGLNYTGHAIGSGLAYVGQGISTGFSNTTSAIGQGYNNIAEHAPGVTKNILLAVGNGVSTVGTGIGNGFNALGTTTHNFADGTGKTIGIISNNIGQGLNNSGNAIAQGFNNTTKATKDGIANLAFGIGEKADGVSNGVSVAIVKFGYLFATEPTRIYDVQVIALTPTSAKVTWHTNHPANGKVNYGLDETYPLDIQTDKRTSYHEFTLSNLTPNTEYHFEVMSQNKNYVYDANREFRTPAE